MSGEMMWWVGAAGRYLTVEELLRWQRENPAPAPDVAETDSERVARLKKFADQGVGEAQYELGYAYSGGHFGLPRDHVESQRYTRLAARQGHQAAIKVLAVTAPRAKWAKWLYMRGIGYK
jgi:TPR repeat protein